MRQALLAGSTGLVGSALLNELIHSLDYQEIHLLNRSACGTLDAKVHEHIINFDRTDDWPLPANVDDVFCALGTTQKKAGREGRRKVDLEYVGRLARFASRLGVHKFLVVSSVGADKTSSNHYLRVKGEMEEAVRRSGVPNVFIFRPSLLTGERSEFRFGERLAQAAMPVLNPLLIGSVKKYRSVSAEQVAKAMLVTALSSEVGTHVIESDRIQELSRREIV